MDQRKLLALAWLHGADAVLYVEGGARSLGGYWAVASVDAALIDNPLKSDGDEPI